MKKIEKNSSKKKAENKQNDKAVQTHKYMKLYRINSTTDQLQKHALMLLNLLLMLMFYDENHLILILVLY